MSVLGSDITRSLGKKIETCWEQRNTGVVRVASQQKEWHIYFLLGKVVWTKRHPDSIRRWLRNIAVYAPRFFEHITRPARLPCESWNYAALARLVKLGQFSRDRFTRIVEGYIAEDFFDMLQVGTVHYARHGVPLNYNSYDRDMTMLPFVMVDCQGAWRTAQQDWDDWQQSDLASFSPDCAPVITELETLRSQTSAKTFERLTTFIDGKNSFRDLAIKFNRPVALFSKSILPYVSVQVSAADASTGNRPGVDVHGLGTSMGEEIGSEEVGDVQTDCDFEAGVASAQMSVQMSKVSKQIASEQIASEQISKTAEAPQLKASPLQSSLYRSYSRSLPTQASQGSIPNVAYIDDSPADSRLMAEIVEGMGYRYTNISNPVQALPMLIELKPKLIFLDLVMPIANGYEVCAQIRRISMLQETPIVIVTSNNGIADRVRAKIVGASGFLGKPIRYKKVERVMKKHLVRKGHLPRAIPPTQQGPTQENMSPYTRTLSSPTSSQVFS